MLEQKNKQNTNAHTNKSEGKGIEGQGIGGRDGAISKERRGRKKGTEREERNDGGWRTIMMENPEGKLFSMCKIRKRRIVGGGGEREWGKGEMQTWVKEGGSR